MIVFPKTFQDILLAYVKEISFRGTRREGFAARPFGREDLRFFAKGVAELSDLFTAERRRLNAGYLNQPQYRAAYLLYFLPINYAKTLFILDQMPTEFWKRDLFRVLDLGCGPGSSSLAFLTSLNRKNPHARVELTLVEQNEKILNDARALLAKLFPKLRLQIHAHALRLEKFRSPGEFDLILMSHVLNEMTQLSAQERAAWLFPKLETALAPEGLLLISEPALKRPTRELMALRDHLLEDKTFCVLAPCLHREICPMLAATAQDWCHFYIDWEEPTYLQELDRLVKNDNRFLKVAYLLLGRTRAYGKLATRPRNFFRVVSNRMKTKGKTELVLCGPPGRLTLSRLDRERQAANAVLDEVRRGEVLEVKGMNLPGYEVGRKARVNPTLTIKKITAF